MSQSFKIFLLVALSFFTSFNLSANDTFFSIEKSSDSINVLANAGGKFKHVDEFLEAIPTSPRNFRDEVINAFDGAKELKYSDGEKLFYRRWGDEGEEIGSWLSTKQLAQQEAKELLALPNNNSAENLTIFKLKEGTPYIEGKVASQIDDLDNFGTYATGGGGQIYILYEDIGNLIKQ